MTGKREVPPTGESQRTSGPRHAAPQARQLRGPRGAAGGGRGRPRPSRCWSGEGGGSGELGGEAEEGRLRRAAGLGGGGANRLSWQRPCWPPRGALQIPVSPQHRGANPPGASPPLPGRSGPRGLRLRRLSRLALLYPVSRRLYASPSMRARSQHPEHTGAGRPASFARRLHT